MKKKNNNPQLHQEAGKKKKHGIITYPDTIGPYTIKQTIGEGAFSLVKLAYHELYYQNYACKIVPIEMIERKKMYKRFELEVRISQLMRHPCVAAITDVLKDQYNFYIFMEYYPNGNLLNYIMSKNRLKEDEAKGIMYQIFNGLEYIHGQGVAHRDLKPENLIIDNEGHIRVSDFGLSQFVNEDHLVKTPCGSPCYVSPEVVSGKDYDGFQSDLWSCGVILYSMVTGMLPWTKRQLKDIFRQIKSGDYKIPRYVSEQCSNLIQMLMTVDPAKRINLVEAMHHTWFNIKSEEDKKNLLNYSIPAKYLKKLKKNADLDVNSVNNHQVPYLSTRKVDIYFRPDVDYDFDFQFDNIKNIHAIDNSTNQDKCHVSSPNIEFDSALRFLNNGTRKIRFRNRSNLERNVGLKSASYMKMQSVSTGKLNITQKIYLDNDDSILAKDKSEIPFKPSDNITPNNNTQKDKSKNPSKRHRKSAGLPKMFR